MTVTLPAVGKEFNPAPVAVVVASGGNESEVIHLNGLTPLALITPALEAATDRIEFKASHDGVTWSTGCAIYQNAVYYIQVPDASKTYPLAIDWAALAGYSHIKLVLLDSSSAAKNQTSDRTFQLICAAL